MDIILITIALYLIVYFAVKMFFVARRKNREKAEEEERVYLAQKLQEEQEQRKQQIKANVELLAHSRFSNESDPISKKDTKESEYDFFPESTFKDDPYYMFFDCETTGLPGSGKVVRIVQIAWILLNRSFELISENIYYLNPGKPIPQDAVDIHHITDEIVQKCGTPHKDVFQKFHEDVEKTTWLIAHNFSFDAGRIDLETRKAKIDKPSLFDFKKTICTMERGTNFCKIEPKVYGQYKWPKLSELAEECGIKTNLMLHDSLYDTYITAKCFEYMVNVGYIRRKGISY